MAIINITPSRVGVQPPSPGMRPAGSPVGAAVAELGATLNELGRREQQARDTDAAASAAVGYATDLVDLRVRAERGEFGPDFRAGFEREAAALRDRRGAEIGSAGARSAFGARATTLAAEQTQRLIITQAERTARMSEANGMRELTDLAPRIAAAPDEASRRQLVETGIAAIDARVASGAIAADAGERMRQGFLSGIDEARVRRLLTDAPGQAVRLLGDDRQFPSLTPERRASLLDTATRRADGEADRALRAADLADRRAERTARGAADRAAVDFLGRLDAARRGEADADGVPVPLPSRADLDRHRDHMSPAEYRAMLAELNDRAPERDSPDAIADLQPRVHSDDPGVFRRDAARALSQGLITAGTYRSLLQQNEAARRDDAPASAYRSGRAFVADALDPGMVIGNEWQRGALTTARQNALADFDTWAEQNPRATREQAVEKARELAARYRQASTDQSRVSLPRPYGFMGDRSRVDERALRAAAAALLARQGTMSPAEFVREEQIIQAWRSLPPPPTPGAPQRRPSGQPRLD
jgi:hypothetical protein